MAKKADYWVVEASAACAATSCGRAPWLFDTEQEAKQFVAHLKARGNWVNIRIGALVYRDKGD